MILNVSLCACLKTKMAETKLRGKPNCCGQICEFCEESYCESCSEDKVMSCWKCGQRHYCWSCRDGALTDDGQLGNDSADIFSVCTNCYCFCDHQGYPKDFDESKRAEAKGACPYCEGKWHDSKFKTNSCRCDCRGKTVFTCLDHRPRPDGDDSDSDACDETSDGDDSDSDACDETSDEEEKGCLPNCDDRHCEKCHKCMDMMDDHQMVSDMSGGVPVSFTFYCMDHASLD